MGIAELSPLVTNRVLFTGLHCIWKDIVATPAFILSHFVSLDITWLHRNTTRLTKHFFDYKNRTYWCTMNLHQTMITDIDWEQIERLRGQESERRRLGSSANDPTRINEEAERLATEARVHKKAGRLHQAHSLYTLAIELDPFNHEYFHHRAETYMKADLTELMQTDAQTGLDLCADVNAFSSDDIFGFLWCTLVRTQIDMMEWESANDFVEVALHVVDESNHLARTYLLNYHSAIQEVLAKAAEGGPISLSSKPARIHTIMDPGDELLFMYTEQAHSTAKSEVQPELLAVDLVKTMDVESIFRHVLIEKFSALGVSENFFQTPCGRYWISVIPVLEAEDRQALQRHLMCGCEEDCKVVVLKVDDAAATDSEDNNELPAPLSETQAKVYIAAIIENASQCQVRYKEGLKLVEEDVLTTSA
jgi:tetratricopeptide (TPR) repeat protein